MRPQPVSARRKTYIVDTFNALPDDLQKRVIKSGITKDEAEKHWEPLLNILHFKTKQNFYTTSQYQNKVKVRRHNKGHSLVDKAIVSVNSLQQETEELLVDSNKRYYKNPLQIGKGGFGRVYQAKSDLDNDTMIAIKRMPHETHKQKRKNFQEIRFLRYCQNHPNIIKIIRASLFNDEMWLVTEHLDGGTLTEAVANHRCQEAEIAYISREILTALNFLHENQLSHRDLKSANIMLDMKANVKLIDFGLCSDISQGEVVHMVGSPFWMPPEMILRKPHGLMVDIWSFGICLMEMANGHPPNRKSSFQAMFVAATTGYPEPLEGNHWSADFNDFVVKCVQVVPSARSDVPSLLKHPFLKRAAERSDMIDLCKTVFSPEKIQTEDA
jgi:serine/threonine protein kinase